MTRPTAEQLATLRQLEKAATPGEWMAEPHFETGCAVMAFDCDRCGFPEFEILRVTNECKHAGERIQADAELVAAMRNALPQLLDYVAELEGLVRDFEKGWSEDDRCSGFEHSDDCPLSRARRLLWPWLTDEKAPPK
jgi:hypothetical protein